MASKVHRIRFYNPTPKSINCASYNKIFKVVAVARSDASIEIWDLSYAPYLLKFIPGVENGSIEALGWVNDRLLSTGLGGALVEWDLNNLVLKRTVLLTGYAAWCLDVNSSQTLVAVGTEQGYVNLYSVENDDIEYRKLFDKQEGRIICCKFDKTGNILVTGSTNTIRVWNVATGQATTRISTKRRGKESIVWSIGVFSDNTIVSGEGCGRLTFWDITTGDQIESYTTHKKDILTIAVSENEDKLYCSGVDPVIVEFVKVVNGKQPDKSVWSKHVLIHNHEHDVRCLDLQGERLISVGVDGYLTLSSYPPKWVMRIPPLLPRPRFSMSAEKKLVCLKHNNHIEVWKLGTHATSDSGEPVFKSASTIQLNKSPKKRNDSFDSAEVDNQFNKTDLLKVDIAPLKLASIQTKKKRQITYSEISPSGEFIIYATDTDVRMLKLEMDEEDDSRTFLSKLPVTGVPSGSGVIARAAFTADSRCCVLRAPRTLLVLAVDPAAGAAPVQTIDTDKYLKAQTLLHLQISKPCPSGAEYLIAADTVGAIAIWARSGGGKFAHYVTLPTYHCVPSALSVDERREILHAVYVDQKVIEYDLRNKKFQLGTDTRLAVERGERAPAVVGVAAHPTRDAMVFCDETNVFVLERDAAEKEDGGQPPSKKRLNTSSESDPTFKTIPIKYLAGFEWLSDEEAVMLEVLPENILMRLPPMLQQKFSFAPNIK